jgi:hypothetical protein
MDARLEDIRFVSFAWPQDCFVQLPLNTALEDASSAVTEIVMGGVETDGCPGALVSFEADLAVTKLRGRDEALRTALRLTLA